jgi:hypothetical protein
MTFEQAAARFAQAESEWRAGRMGAEQMQAAAVACRVTDAQGRVWQIDPGTRQWLMWNGQAWTAAPQTPQAPPPQTPQSPQHAAAGAGMGLGAGVTAVLPGIAIDVWQRWSLYKTNPQAALSVAAPGLLSALLPPLVPKIGRWPVLLILFACLAWLAWPVVAQMSAGSAEAGAMQREMGRGVVGLSLLSLISRVWRAR